MMIGDTLALLDAAAPATATPATLDGSWYLHLEPTWPHLATAIRGPLRIQAGADGVCASADLYVHRGPCAAAPLGAPITAAPFLIGRDWFPHLPPAQYAFHLRTTRVQPAGGRLTLPFTRHVRDRLSGRFAVADGGRLVLDCSQVRTHAAGLPRPTVRLTGAAWLGGRRYRLVATKTADRYRAFGVQGRDGRGLFAAQGLAATPRAGSVWCAPRSAAALLEALQAAVGSVGLIHAPDPLVAPGWAAGVRCTSETHWGPTSLSA